MHSPLVIFTRKFSAQIIHCPHREMISHTWFALPLHVGLEYNNFRVNSRIPEKYTRAPPSLPPSFPLRWRTNVSAFPLEDKRKSGGLSASLPRRKCNDAERARVRALFILGFVLISTAIVLSLVRRRFPRCCCCHQRRRRR